MKASTAWLVSAALVLVVRSVVPAPQSEYHDPAHQGPYRVVISKPIVGLAYTAGDLYRHHEYLSAMFNQLDAEGLTPILTNVMTQTLDGREDEDRLLVVCRSR